MGIVPHAGSCYETKTVLNSHVRILHTDFIPGSVPVGKHLNDQ